MKCIKTGAQIFVEAYGLFGHCDAFELNGIHLFRVVDTGHTARGPKIHFTIHKVDQWFDQYLIAQGGVSTLISSKVTDHGYDGVLFDAFAKEPS